MRKTPFDEQANWFFLKCDNGIYFFEVEQTSIQDNIGDLCCHGWYCAQLKWVIFHTWKENDGNCYEFFQRKACCHILNIPFKDHQPTFILLCGDGIFYFVTKTSREYENKRPSPLWRHFSTKHNQPHPNLYQQKQKSFHIWHKSTLVDTSNQKGITFHFFYSLSVYLERHDFFRIQQRYWVVSRLWTKFSYYD